MYEQKSGGAFQRLFKSITGIAIPHICGTGLFGGWGLLPRAAALNTVFGEPLLIDQCTTPTAEQIALVQQRYVEALEKLFDDNKEQYHPGAHLVIK